MATAVNYQIQTNPSSSFHGSMYQSQPYAYSTAPMVTSAPFAPNQSGVRMNAHASGVFGQNTPGTSSLVGAAVLSRSANPDVSTAVSHVSGVVPTGLYTSYIPAQAVTVRETDAVNASGKQPTTVYYTDDLYPPYYSKAKKVSATKKRTGCCA